MKFRFTKDWFSKNIPFLKRNIPAKTKNILEIGSYEGRSTIWFHKNYLKKGGTITCIDTFQGSIEHQGENNTALFERFNNNLKAAKVNYNVIVGKSFMSLIRLIGKNRYDFIYIDGSHHSKDVATDMFLAFQLLRIGGVMIVDDYEWKMYERPSMTPKIAVDFFIESYCDEIKVIEKGYQVAIKRIRKKKIKDKRLLDLKTHCI